MPRTYIIDIVEHHLPGGGSLKAYDVIADAERIGSFGTWEKALGFTRLHRDAYHEDGEPQPEMLVGRGECREARFAPLADSCSGTAEKLRGSAEALADLASASLEMADAIEGMRAAEGLDLIG